MTFSSVLPISCFLFVKTRPLLLVDMQCEHVGRTKGCAICASITLSLSLRQSCRLGAVYLLEATNLLHSIQLSQ